LLSGLVACASVIITFVRVNGLAQGELREEKQVLRCAQDDKAFGNKTSLRIRRGQ
jgi:hypothetical protein